ncbi:MAG: hypothetical protein HY556_06660 [Euryarchaeota archaeon]|nr:hypothetical protein [Euryarchaeota archaeon]
MKARTVTLLTVLGMIALVAPVQAGDPHTECSGGGNDAAILSAAGRYVVSGGNNQNAALPSLYEESNGQPMLQKTARHCIDYDEDDNVVAEYDLYGPDAKKL